MPENNDYGYADGYLKKKFGNSNEYQFAQPMQGDSSSEKTDSSGVKDFLTPSPEFAKGASRGAGGGLGSALISGGIASLNPYAIGGGVALSALEGDAQAKQAEEEAKSVEAQQRKQAQLSAINNLISVSKGLSVM